MEVLNWGMIPSRGFMNAWMSVIKKNHIWDIAKCAALLAADFTQLDLLATTCTPSGWEVCNQYQENEILSHFPNPIFEAD